MGKKKSLRVLDLGDGKNRPFGYSIQPLTPSQGLMHSKVEWAWYILCKIPFGLENGGKLSLLVPFSIWVTQNHGRVVLRTLDPFLIPKAVSKFAKVLPKK
jgi:hypothetical protein